MTITLKNTYLDSKTRKQELEAELLKLEQKLKSPERTVDDIVRHIKIVKEYRQYN